MTDQKQKPRGGGGGCTLFIQYSDDYEDEFLSDTDNINDDKKNTSSCLCGPDVRTATLSPRYGDSRNNNKHINIKPVSDSKSKKNRQKQQEMKKKKKQKQTEDEYDFLDVNDILLSSLDINETETTGESTATPIDSYVGSFTETDFDDDESDDNETAATTSGKGQNYYDGDDETDTISFASVTSLQSLLIEVGSNNNNNNNKSSTTDEEKMKDNSQHTSGSGGVEVEIINGDTSNIEKSREKDIRINGKEQHTIVTKKEAEILDNMTSIHFTKKKIKATKTNDNSASPMEKKKKKTENNNKPSIIVKSSEQREDNVDDDDIVLPVEESRQDVEEDRGAILSFDKKSDDDIREAISNNNAVVDETRQDEDDNEEDQRRNFLSSSSNKYDDATRDGISITYSSFSEDSATVSLSSKSGEEEDKYGKGRGKFIISARLRNVNVNKNRKYDQVVDDDDDHDDDSCISVSPIHSLDSNLYPTDESVEVCNDKNTTNDVVINSHPTDEELSLTNNNNNIVNKDGRENDDNDNVRVPTPLKTIISSHNKDLTEILNDISTIDNTAAANSSNKNVNDSLEISDDDLQKIEDKQKALLIKELGNELKRISSGESYVVNDDDEADVDVDVEAEDDKSINKCSPMRHSSSYASLLSSIMITTDNADTNASDENADNDQSNDDIDDIDVMKNSHNNIECIIVRRKHYRPIVIDPICDDPGNNVYEIEMQELLASTSGIEMIYYEKRYNTLCDVVEKRIKIILNRENI